MEDVAQVRLHRLRAEEESRGDLGVGVASHDEVGNLPFPLGQRLESVPAGLAGTGSMVDVTSQPPQLQLRCVPVPQGTAGVQRGGGRLELGDGAFGFTGSRQGTPGEGA